MSKTPPDPARAFNAALRARLADAALDARTIDKALEALASIAPPLRDPRPHAPRVFELRETEFKARIVDAMRRAGCPSSDCATAADIVLGAYGAHLADLPFRHTRATRNEIISALFAELHPQHRAA